MLQGAILSSGWYVLGGILVGVIVGYGIAVLIQKKQRVEQGCLSEKTPQELDEKVSFFAGNMNALWDITRQTDLALAKVTFDNIQQVIEMKGNDAMKTWYSQVGNDRSNWDISVYRHKAKLLLDTLMKCGLQVCEETEIVWQEEAAKKYNKLSAVQNGQKCKVLAPYWMYNGCVFEKGLVQVV